MEYLIHQLIDKEECTSIIKNITKGKCSWISGKSTAGSHASLVKNNLQLDKNSSVSIINSKNLAKKISSDPLIKSFALPRKIHGLMFTKSSSGQGYGKHVDNAYMSSGRSDLSFTVFLQNASEYEGGELCIEELQETRSFKLDAGQIIIYPSTSIHSVKNITQGERIVSVGWIQSYVKSSEDRYCLFGLEAGARGLLAKNGRSDELDLIFQAYGNLLRRLGD